MAEIAIAYNFYDELCDLLGKGLIDGSYVLSKLDRMIYRMQNAFVAIGEPEADLAVLRSLAEAARVVEKSSGKMSAPPMVE